jgi:hypothetical protein
MHSYNGRRFVRLRLESLEGRDLPSTTVLPAPVLGPAVVSTASVAQTATFSTHWVVGPSAIMQGTNSTTYNGKSTGSVALSLYRDTSLTGTVGGAAVTEHVGVLTTTSSASTTKPDVFHTPFTLTLTVRDAATGKTGLFTFHGTINGTLSWQTSHLTVTFQSPLTQKLTVGSHVYTVTLKPPAGYLPAPGAPHANIDATIQVSKPN